MTGKFKLILFSSVCLLALTVAKGVFAATDFVSKIRASGGDYDKLSTWEVAIESDLTATTSRVFTVSAVGSYDMAIDNGQTVTFSGGGTGTLKHINTEGQAYIINIAGTVNVGVVTVDSSAHTFTVSDTGEQIGLAIAECYNDWPAGLDDNLVISGWTTNAEHYVKIYTPESERHNGTVAGDGFFLKSSDTGNSYNITLINSYNVIEGLKIVRTATNWAYGSIIYTYPTSGNGKLNTVRNNLFIQESGGGYGAMIIQSGANTEGYGNKFYNNILISQSDDLRYGIEYNRSYDQVAAQQSFYFNNTVYGKFSIAGFSIDVDNAASGDYHPAVLNNIVVNTGTGTDFAFANQYSASSPNFYNNISADSSAGTERNNQSATLEQLDFGSTTAGAEDLHISQDSAAFGIGVDSPFVVIAKDIDGQTRIAWDIGADEVSVDFVASVMQSGGDYSSLAAWEAAIQTDLTAGTTAVFAHGGITGAIVDGDTVTGVTSGATATVLHATATQVLLENISGTFQSGEQLQVDGSNHLTISSKGHPANAIAKVDGSWNAADTSRVDIDGWTTGPENYIRIYTTETARHFGAWDDNRYRLVMDEMWSSVVNIREDFVRLEGLQIYNTHLNDGAPQGIRLFNETSGVGEMQLAHNIIKFPGEYSNSSQVGIDDLYLSDQTVAKIWNNIIFNAYEGINLSYGNTYYSDWVIYNNTIVNSKSKGIVFKKNEYNNPGNLLLKNNLIVGSRVQDYDINNTSFLTSYQHVSNLSSDNSSPDGASFQNKSITFANTVGGDFHLALTDIAAIGQGTDLSGDTDLAFATDIDDTTRGSAWDIGADELPVPFVTTIMESGGDFSSLADWENSVDNLDLRAPEDKVFSHGGVTGSFSVGNTVTGQTSGATGRVVSAVTGTQILLRDIAGTFVAGEQLQRDASNYVVLSNGGEPASLEVKIDGVWSSPDSFTTTKYFNDWETDHDNSVRIYTTSTARHNGSWSTSSYRLLMDTAPTQNTPIGLFKGNIEIDGLQIDNPTTGGNGIAVDVAAGAGWYKFSNNIIRGNAGAGSGIKIKAGREVKIFNNIIYDWAEAGILFISDADNVVSYVVNNTIENIASYHGISQQDPVTGAVIVKNNIVQNTAGSGFYGTFGVGSGYNISSDATAPGASSKHNITISFVDLAGEDYHLAESEVNARSFGENLSNYSPLPFAADIDGQARPQDARWDVGADEVTAATTLYRSVGTNADNLNTGAATVEIIGTTATFSAAMPDKIGVGDILQYGSPAKLAFITGRTSATEYSVKNSIGEDPAAAAAGTTVAVYRAYTSLANWEAQNENDSLDDTVEDFDTSTDLVANNSKMYVTCYGDGVDTAGVAIAGWATGIDNYIKIYTPVASTEVGTSQRHSGVWDDEKYYINRGHGSAILIRDDFVRIEGLQIQVDLDYVSSHSGINVESYQNSQIYITDNIIKEKKGESYAENGISFAYTEGSSNRTAYVSNNLIYDFDNNSSGNSIIVGSAADSWTVNLSNNTVANCENGIVHVTGTVIVKNNIVQNCEDGYVGSFDAASDYNISDIAADAPGANSKNSTVVEFQNILADDFHLAQTDTVAREAGTDLSTDANFAFTKDVDGQLRTSWDIGADEGSVDFVTTVSESGGDFSSLAAWEAGIQSDLVADSTRVFSHGGITGAVVAGDTVLGLQSGVSATVIHATTTQVLLENISGTFQTGEQVRVDESNHITIADAGNPVNAIAKIDGKWSGADSNTVVIDGWTTGASDYIKIYTTDTARHKGTANSGYTLTHSTNADVIYIYEDNVRIDGLVIEASRGGDDPAIRYEGGGELEISNNILHRTANTGSGIWLSALKTGAVVKIWNNIIYDFSGAGILFQDGGASTHHIYNNTVMNCLSRNIYYRDAADIYLYLKNNIAQNGGSSDYFIEVSSNLDTGNNIASDISSPNDSFDNTVVLFVDQVNKDFHLDTSDTAARDAGTDLIFTDAKFNFQTDIDGTTRGAGIDIGADELPREFVSTVCENSSAGGDCANLDYNSLAAWEAGVDVDLANKGTRVYSGALSGSLASGSVVTLIRGAVSTGITGTVEALTSDQLLIRELTGTTSWELDGYIAQDGDIWQLDGSKYWTVAGSGDDLGASALAAAKIDGTWNNPDTNQVVLDGWESDSDNYIKIYTTTLARHKGVAGTGYRLVVNNQQRPFYVREAFVHIEGLEIDNSENTSDLNVGIHAASRPDTEGFLHINHSIIHGSANSLAAVNLGDFVSIPTYLANNIVYDFERGFTDANPNAPVYIYNNTIMGADYGVYTAVGAANKIVKNNIVDASIEAFRGNWLGDNNISTSADLPTGSNNQASAIPSFVDSEGDDFHLTEDDTVAKDGGTDLTADPNYAFAVDIDGDARLAGVWDIGADETVTKIYRSVGNESVDFAIASSTVEIAGTTATFSQAQADKVGVGDVIQYGTSPNFKLAFIAERISSTVYTVQSSTGAVPVAAPAGTAVGIYRAHLELNDWEVQTVEQVNSGIDDSVDDLVLVNQDLVATNTVMMVTCYHSSTVDDAAVSINGWTTSASNYLRIYTPTEESEVGISQRHQGTDSDTVYTLNPSVNANAITIDNSYIRIEGLNLEGWSHDKYGIWITGEIRGVTISENLVHDKNIGTGSHSGIYLGPSGFYDRDTNYAFNNIVYNVKGGSSPGISLAQENAANNIISVYNNTVYNCERGVVASVIYNLQNNLAFGNTNADFAITTLHGTASHNISSDSTAPGTNSQINVTGGQLKFISLESGAEDLHLHKDSVAVGVGAELSAIFAGDIDNDLRFASATITRATKDGGLLAWDIGADQTATEFVSRIRAATEADADATSLSSWEAAIQSDLAAETTQVFFYNPATINGAIPNASAVIGETSGATATAVNLTKASSTAQMLLTGVSGNFQVGEKVYIQGRPSDTDYVYLLSPGLPVIAVAEAYHDWPTGLLDHVAVDGWTTSAQNFIKIYTPISERHQGKAYDDSNYSGFAMVSDADYVMQVSEPYTQVAGIVMNVDGKTQLSQPGFGFSSSYGSVDSVIVFNALDAGIKLEANQADLPVYLSNSLIYDNGGSGLVVPTKAFVYNITTVDNGSYGVDKNATDTAYLKNILAFGNTTGDFTNSGTGTLELQNCLSADGTADDFGGTGNRASQTVQFINETEDDFHLSPNDLAARNWGVDLNNDLNHGLFTDIDGDERGAGGWDIGADETSSQIFRSVGPGNTTTLQNGAGNNLTIVGTTATFSADITDNIGVGDVIQYDADNNGEVDQLVFIHRRISKTQFTVKTNTGEAPVATTAADQDWDIFRAYISLANAEAGIENTGIGLALRNFDNWTAGGDATTDEVGKDLTATNQQWNIACYKDAVDISSVAVAGWTTNDVSFLKIFTPTRLSEVGTTQRHRGIKDTGYKLQVAGGFAIDSSEGIVIEGLEIENTLNGVDQGEILVSGDDYLVATIKNNMLYGGIAGVQTAANFSTKLEIYNNFIFDATYGIYFAAAGAEPSAFIYNNTVVGCESGVLKDAVSITPTVRNTIVVGSLVEDFDINNGTINIYSSISADSTADNFGGSGNFVDQTVSFLDEANQDFHLSVSDTAAREKGADLSADAQLPFWLDIDGEARAYGVAWDIGADESVNTNTTIRGGVNIKGGVEIKN